MRPPLRRYSSVSIANQILSPERARSAAASASSPLAPWRAACAAANTLRPRPPQAERLSKTWMRSPPRPSSMSCWRACLAESQVPEIPDERCRETISRPSSSSGPYTDTKSPTEGCDVVAIPGLALSRS